MELRYFTNNIIIGYFMYYIFDLLVQFRKKKLFLSFYLFRLCCCTIDMGNDSGRSYASLGIFDSIDRWKSGHDFRGFYIQVRSSQFSRLQKATNDDDENRREAFNQDHKMEEATSVDYDFSAASPPHNELKVHSNLDIMNLDIVNFAI